MEIARRFDASIQTSLTASFSTFLDLEEMQNHESGERGVQGHPWGMNEGKPILCCVLL